MQRSAIIIIKKKLTIVPIYYLLSRLRDGISVAFSAIQKFVFI